LASCWSALALMALLSSSSGLVLASSSRLAVGELSSTGVVRRCRPQALLAGAVVPLRSGCLLLLRRASLTLLVSPFGCPCRHSSCWLCPPDYQPLRGCCPPQGLVVVRACDGRACVLVVRGCAVVLPPSWLLMLSVALGDLLLLQSLLQGQQRQPATATQGLQL
jgi:hypothetical protein